MFSTAWLNTSEVVVNHRTMRLAGGAGLGPSDAPLQNGNLQPPSRNGLPRSHSGLLWVEALIADYSRRDI